VYADLFHGSHFFNRPPPPGPALGHGALKNINDHVKNNVHGYITENVDD